MAWMLAAFLSIILLGLDADCDNNVKVCQSVFYSLVLNLHYKRLLKEIQLISAWPVAWEIFCVVFNIKYSSSRFLCLLKCL